jgi:hypothetical protein
MPNAVDEFIVKLSRAPLLVHVGEPIDDPTVIQVRSWMDALKSSRDRTWYDFLIDRNNELAALTPLDKSTGEQFVRFVRRTLPQLHAIFERAAAKIGLLPNDAATVVRYGPWITLRACDEIAHADRYKTHWHRDISKWFLTGHFPCGWQGDWPEGGEPNGKLVVF